MKFTITRINRQNQLMVSQKSIDRFWERIARNCQLSAAAPKRVDDLKAFQDNEFLYMKAVQEAQADMAEANMKWANENDQFFAFLSAVAAKLCRMGMSEEEAFIHIRRNNWNDASEEEFRQIVGSAYATHSKDRKTEKASSGRKGRADILQMKNFLQSRYQFRYNAVMKYTEYPCPRPHRSYPSPSENGRFGVYHRGQNRYHDST